MPFTRLPSLYLDESKERVSKQKEEHINKTAINIVIEALLRMSFSFVSFQNSVSALDSAYLAELIDASDSDSQDKSKLQR